MQNQKTLPQIGQFQTPYLGQSIRFWEDAPSLEWLARTLANKPFLNLARFYESQFDKFMCAPASIAMVLNALKKDSQSELPIDESFEDYAKSQGINFPEGYVASFPRFSQRNIFCECTRPIKTRSQLYGAPDDEGQIEYGLSLVQISYFMEAFGFNAQVNYVYADDDKGHEDNLKHALSTEGHYVIANFDRSVWKLDGGGHVSPLGAMDLISRKVLIMDVNINGRWLWIDCDLLVQSMASLDTTHPRGYVIVSKR